jgi:hypothetical protein
VGDMSSWTLNPVDLEIMQVLTSWRQDVVFRPTFRSRLHDRFRDEEDLMARRPTSKTGVKTETVLSRRIGHVIAGLEHAGLVRRDGKFEVEILDRAGIRAVIAAGVLTYPRREQS